jgi:hypothetical protein
MESGRFLKAEDQRGDLIRRKTNDTGLTAALETSRV